MWLILRPFLPYLAATAVAFSLGWSGAWYVQGVRINAVQQDLTAYQQGITAAVQSAREYENARNVEASNAWAANLDALRKSWRSGWVPVVPTEGGGSGFRVPSSTGTDDACREPILAARRIAQDCGETTAKLNALQARIESQAGY